MDGVQVEGEGSEEGNSSSSGICKKKNYSLGRQKLREGKCPAQEHTACSVLDLGFFSSLPPGIKRVFPGI